MESFYLKRILGRFKAAYRAPKKKDNRVLRADSEKVLIESFLF